MELAIFKALAIAAVFAVALVGGLAPLRVKPSPRTARFFSRANCLAAGVFLTTGILHMLPDGLAALEDTGLDRDSAHFNVGFLLVLGFAATLFAEHVAAPTGAHRTGSGGPTTQPTAVADSLLLLLVLSLHSLFEGLALGAQTEIVGAAILLLAIVAHKGTEAFALGVSLLHGGIAPGRTQMTIIRYACITPLGIVLGTLLRVALAGREGGRAEGWFDGLAAGTFLYVAASHSIPEEFEEPADRWAKFAFFAVGVAIMTAVGLVV
jgi:solute carrier family 39 (zinc transporter), member 1/2/3